MIVDFHTHIFPEKIAAATIEQLEQKSGLKAATNGMLEGLLASMDAAEIDRSVILPVVTAPRQFEGVNNYGAELNKRYGNRLISFGGIHPDSEDYRGQLKTLKSMGFKGIKVHPDYQGVCFDDIRYERIVEYASELDMIVLAHAGIDIGLPNPVRCTPAMAARVLKDTGAKKLVLAHLGGWKLWDEVEEYLVSTNAYFDTAFIHPFIEREQFVRIVNNHGSDKILFATDSPWSDQAEAVAWIKNCNFSCETEENILYKNALYLLK